MIVFDLKCPSGHVFEAWFGSSGDYESQRARGLVQCPVCGDAGIGKAVMSPRIGAKGNQVAARPDGAVPVSSDPDAKQMLAALATLQKKMLARSEHVGRRFADEARAIHLGEAQKRSIFGEATRAETESLREEGIVAVPLPFPVVEPGREN